MCINISKSGIYTCSTPLDGNFVGLLKNGIDFFIWVELRAYEMPPMTLTEAMFVTNTIPNSTLMNALILSKSFSIEIPFTLDNRAFKHFTELVYKHI